MKHWIIFYNGNIQSNLKEKLKYYTYKGDNYITFFQNKEEKDYVNDYRRNYYVWNWMVLRMYL